MNKHLKIAAALLVALPALALAQVRTEQTFEKGWKFTREDSKDFSQQTYDDTKWQSVTVPHDWAIYGPFSIENDKQKVAITQDGQKEALEHAGRTGGLPFVGVGWYRLNFEAPAFSSGKKATLIFDGAMSHARVYINGQEALRLQFVPHRRHSLFKSGRTEHLGRPSGKRNRIFTLVSGRRPIPQRSSGD